MPILLDAPFNPGDLDIGNTYPHCKIVRANINIDSERIELIWTYGEEVSGVWSTGNAAPGKNVNITGEDYDTILATEVVSGDNNLVYEGVKRAFYQYLLDKDLVDGVII